MPKKHKKSCAKWFAWNVAEACTCYAPKPSTPSPKESFNSSDGLLKKEGESLTAAIPEPVTGEDEAEKIWKALRSIAKRLPERDKNVIAVYQGVANLVRDYRKLQEENKRLENLNTHYLDEKECALGHLIVAGQENTRLRTELEEARKDSKRLDYLGDYVASASNGYGEDGRAMYSDHSTHVKVYFTNHDLPLVPRTSEDYIRDAIDKAISEVPQ